MTESADKTKIKELEEIIERQKEELSKWPRVFWESGDPKSSTEGYKIIAVEGKEEYDDEGWFDVWVNYGGEEVAAATDFGVYSSEESLERHSNEEHKKDVIEIDLDEDLKE